MIRPEPRRLILTIVGKYLLYIILLGEPRSKRHLWIEVRVETNLAASQQTAEKFSFRMGTYYLNPAQITHRAKVMHALELLTKYRQLQ